VWVIKGTGVAGEGVVGVEDAVTVGEEGAELGVAEPLGVEEAG
jgi:hypothetical protein